MNGRPISPTTKKAKRAAGAIGSVATLRTVPGARGISQRPAAGASEIADNPAVKRLLAIFDRMTDEDRAFMIRYGEACVVENPRRVRSFTIIKGGRES